MTGDLTLLSLIGSYLNYARKFKAEKTNQKAWLDLYAATKSKWNSQFGFLKSLKQRKNLVHRGIKLKQGAFVPFFFQNVCDSRKYQYPRKGGSLKNPKPKIKCVKEMC